MDNIESMSRLNPNDSERSKLLKQVLKSSAQLHREIHMTLGGQKKGMFDHDDDDPNEEKKVDALPASSSKAVMSGSELAEQLSRCAYGDSQVCEDPFIVGPDLSPVL
ncbi:unnamed protein product, partial [Polarella glacialis]